MKFNIDDRFNRQLPADPRTENVPRPVERAAFSFVTPRVPTRPLLLHASVEAAGLIGLNHADLASNEFLQVLSGARVLPETKPYAMCYGGHQFGSWAGQLGDGRAINLFETKHAGTHWTLQLKGAGATPYSRTADGLAVLRSSLREHLCSEAMFHLGVPTSRSLSLILTGDQVMRDVMYDGNPARELGAVVCRMAPSFIRFGNFEIFAARKDVDNLRKIADFTIEHFFPGVERGTSSGYAEFFRTVCQRTLTMIIHWQRVGFVHGVMNTDNMSIHGETIDYGPYGWLEGYDLEWTPNTTDRQHRRYRFGNQPQIALWNLLQLANAIYPLVADAAVLESSLHEYQTDIVQQMLRMRISKIGLIDSQTGDDLLVSELDSVLQLTETDMTIFFRNLADVSSATAIDTGSDFLQPVIGAFYEPANLTGELLEKWRGWFGRYIQRLSRNNEPDTVRRQRMNAINPKYVLRNYMAQLAIDKANEGDHSMIDELYQLLKRPYDEQLEQQKWFARRPEWARNKVGCSMLSCSS